MTEQFTSSTEQDAPHSALHPAELTAMYATIHNMLDRGTPVEDVRGVASSLLEKAGYSPLAEHESQRTVTVEIDGVEQEQAIAVDLDDFGVFLLRPEDMGIEGFADVVSSTETETPVGHIEHALGRTALSEAINEGMPRVNERLGEVPASESEAAVVESEPALAEAENGDDAGERSREYNDELMQDARKVLAEFVDLDESTARDVRRAADEIAEMAVRPMLDTDHLAALTRSIHMRLSNLIEQGTTVSKKLAAVGDGLDPSAENVSNDHRDIDDAYATIRRAAGNLEAEVVSELHIVDRIVQDLGYDPSARQQLVARTRHLADVIDESTKRHSRILQDIQI